MSKVDNTNGLYPESYGRWAGNPKGHAPDFARCCQEVCTGGRWPRWHQCNRPRGHGPDGAYCRQHDPVIQAFRKHEADQRYAKKHNRERAGWYGADFLAALRQIAAGHNDARGLASEIVTKFDAGAMKVDPVPTPTTAAHGAD